MNATFHPVVVFAFIMGKNPMDGGSPWVRGSTIALIGLVFLVAGMARWILAAKSSRRKDGSVAPPAVGYLLATGLGLNLVAILVTWFG
jgi:uncharacterized membrane protein YidH (DUF202 family)